MPIYTVQAPDGKTYDIEGPEGATAEQLGGFIAQNSGPKPYDVGAFGKRAMQFGQGVSFGFGDEIASKLGADKDRYNATLEQHRTEEPVGAVLSNLAGGISTPLAALKIPKILKSAVPALDLLGKSPMLTAGGTGLLYGGLQGAGDSSEGQGVGGEALKSGGIGATLGLGMMGAIKAASPFAGAIGNAAAANMPGVGQKYSMWLARNRVADAFNRDNLTVADVGRNMQRLGAEARFADAAGENTRGTLDLNANLPGRTKDELETLIRNRQATRPDRMDDAVYAVNGGYGRAGDVNKSLEAQKIQESAPLYQRLHGMDIPISDNLRGILNASKKLGAAGTASKIATAERVPFSFGTKESTEALMNATNGGRISMRDADLIKRGIDDLIESQTDAVTGKVTTLGRSYVRMKSDLLGELDNLTIDPKTGVSLYKSARDAFAGPASLQTAM